MSNNQYVVEASTSRCKKQSKRTATSDRLFKDDVKGRRRNAELQQLEGRLRALEEEAEMLKGDLLESVEESRKLITEIHQQFNTIRRRLLQREGESHCRRIQIMSLFEGRRDGLLQVLYQDSNPSMLDKSLNFQPKLPWNFHDGD